MAFNPTSAETVITELRRTGDGVLEDTLQVFRLTGAEHSAAQGDLNLHLQVTTVRKNMPGSNKVVEHAMAATWQPFDIQGEFNDSWGNRQSSQLGTVARSGSYARFMFDEMAKLVSRMSLVRVEIDGLSFVGLLTDFKPRYQRKTRIGWVLTLSPHENESIQVDRPVVIVTQTLAKWLQDAQDYGTELDTQFEMLKSLSLKTPRVDRFTEGLNEINDALDRLNGIGLNGFGTDVERKLLLMASTFRRLRGASLQVTLALSRLTSSVDLAFADAMQAVRHSEWVNWSLVTVWRMIGLSTRAEIDSLRRARQKPKAIYYPKRNESLERISMRFYGTPDGWRAIYDRNNLASLALNGDEELLIPERGQ